MRKQRVLTTLILICLTLAYAQASAAWDPPIGIPRPPFGIDQTHMIYADPSYTYDYGNGPEPYRIGPDGPYTHYVDPNHPNATDVDNPYGTHTKPRIVRPNAIHNLPAGSVMEMHSGLQPGVGPIYGSGTPTLPIFIRGVVGDQPTFDSVFYINGDYIVMENLKFDLGDYARRTIAIGYYDEPRTHIAIRGCEFYNGMYDPNQSYQVIRIKHTFNNSDQMKNIVIYNNHFHNIGDGRTTPVKCDVVGVAISQNVENVWIVDNLFHHLGGDGIQIATDNPDANHIVPNHIYIGRNVCHDMYENFIDLKMCEDVIISQNTAYDFGAGYTELGGDSLPFRYGAGEGIGPKGRNNIWTIFNEVYRSSRADGAFSSWNVESQAFEPWADEIYYIGNIVYDSNVAFCNWNQQGIYYINNVAYNCELGLQTAGIGATSGNEATLERLTFVNNIFGKRDPAGGFNINIVGDADYLDNIVMANNLLYNDVSDATVKWGVWDGNYSYSAYTFDEFVAFKPSQTTGWIEADPLHLDADNNDFHLQSTSPAIDAGVDAQVYYDRFYNRYGVDISVDFAGNPRPQGTGWDIGPYEYVVSILYGDVSGNSIISATDASMAARYAVGLITLTADQIIRAEVSGNGTVSATDAGWIARKAVDPTIKFPVE